MMPSHASPTRPASTTGAFIPLAAYRGLGGVLASLVGPGPVPGSERVYQSYIYSGGTLDLVAIDPDSGEHQVFRSPVPSEPGAWALAAGGDGNLYVGTLPHAHLLRLDPVAGTLTDLGRPSETEQYIWQLALGADRRLYGCTYPSAKLVRFDPATGAAEDLGRMDPVEQYARSVAADDDGFVYTGIGSSKAHIVAYEIVSGRHADVLPEPYQVTGFASVHRGDDCRVYGQSAGQAFRLEGWEAVPIPPAAVRRQPGNRLQDARLVQVTERVVRVRDPGTGAETERPFGYPGKGIDVFRLGLGPDGLLYASTVLPIHFFRVHPQSGEWQELGRLGGGEFYSFLRHGSFLLGAAYSGDAPLMRYDPEQPFAPGKESNANPLLVTYQGQDSGWRPTAMIAGPDDRIYLGAVAGYGKLGGPLTAWDPATNRVQSFHQVVEDQSVVSLAVAQGMIVGGTTVRGGGGSHPTQTEARLFVWDPRAQQKLFEATVVAGTGEITDLLAAPNGLVYGIAGGATLFVFDPQARRTVHTAALPFRGTVYNSVALGPDGRIWGLTGQGIFAIDPVTHAVALVAEAPARITAGFALQGHNLYYASGPRIYRYTLPVR